MSRRQKARLLTAVEILADVAITEDPIKLRIEELHSVIKARIVIGRQMGMKPVLMFWSNGMQAHTMIPLADHAPPPQDIVDAYRQGINFQEKFPHGVLVCQDLDTPKPTATGRGDK